MGVYIKGVEIPKDKAVAVVIHPDGTAYTAEMFAGVCTEYLADCTAVPVPPHGDLIDRKALLADTTDMIHTMMVFGGARVYTSDAIKNAPTIIQGDPAEEGET